MLDDTLSSLGLFKIIIKCPIYETRDWKRHRTAMPWLNKLIIYKDSPVLTPYLLNEFLEKKMISIEQKNIVESLLKDFYTNKVKNIQNIPIESLYALPLGTLMEIEGHITFNHLVYMLELRANAHGVNKEYQNRALKGLNLLNDYLDPSIIKYFKINQISK